MKILLRPTGRQSTTSLRHETKTIVVDYGDDHDYEYAVLIPACHNVAPALYKTERGAIAAYEKLLKQKYYNITIMDRNGMEYIAIGGKLVLV
jgi:hypothetical protein